MRPRGAVAIEVERAICGHGVARVLDRLGLSRGLPQVIRTDNGKEFCDQAMVTWAHPRGVVPAPDRTRQAESERLRRVLQRPVPRRMPQRTLVVPLLKSGGRRTLNSAGAGRYPGLLNAAHWTWAMDGDRPGNR